MKLAVIAMPIAALALAGCASSGSTAATAAASKPAATATATPPPAPSSSPAFCMTPSCVARGMDRSLPGIVDTDGSVLTKADCKASTVKHNANGSYTVTCVASYSDGSAWRGYGTVQDDKVYFQAETEVR